jgi:hypothetical protein
MAGGVESDTANTVHHNERDALITRTQEEEEKLKSGSPVDQTGIRACHSKSRGAR